MKTQITQIKASFIRYLLALDYESTTNHHSLLDDMDFVINCNLEIRNTPVHNELLRWADNALINVSRGLR